MKRIQIQLTDKKLDDVVREMAETAIHDLESLSQRNVNRAEVIRSSIRGVLEKYVHAYDTCGLAAICHEAAEIDPWEIKDQDKD